MNYELNNIASFKFGFIKIKESPFAGNILSYNIQEILIRSHIHKIHRRMEKLRKS